MAGRSAIVRWVPSIPPGRWCPGTSRSGPKRFASQEVVVVVVAAAADDDDDDDDDDDHDDWIELN